MTTQPDQNQPTPEPFNVPADKDRANPANWVSDETQAAPEPAKKTDETKAPAKKTASSK